MPRNRMIQSEFPNDKKLAINTSRDTRLTFILMWIFSDDYGVVIGEPIWLKNMIYPYDEKLTLSKFISYLDELKNGGWIIPFTDNGDKYYYIRKFIEHQTINKPSKKRNPEPPEDILQEHYRSPTEPLLYEKKRNRKEIEKNIYGEFENVFLTDDEFEKLKNRFPDYKERIESLSSYLKSKGKRYKDHYATILVWARKDPEKPTYTQPLEETPTPEYLKPFLDGIGKEVK